jgi:LysR family glycine cleavage system transcriptional activator
MAQLEQATERFLPSTTRPKLTIATSVSIAQWIIAPRLSAFLAAHPDCALQIATTIWPDDFASTNADIEIRFGRREVVGQGATLLEPSYLHGVAAPTLAEKPLMQQRLIQPVGVSTGWPDLLQLADLPANVEAQVFVDTHGLAVDLAVSGAGVALAHSQITRAALDDGRLCAVPLPRIKAEEGYYLARKSELHPELQSAFVTFLQTG